LATRACGVHENRDLAQGPDGFLGQARGFGRFGKIGLLDIGAQHPGALGLEGVGDAAADTARGAGHQRSIALKQL
jgi:hypothetical protein